MSMLVVSLFLFFAFWGHWRRRRRSRTRRRRRKTNEYSNMKTPGGWDFGTQRRYLAKTPLYMFNTLFPVYPSSTHPGLYGSCWFKCKPGKKKERSRMESIKEPLVGRVFYDLIGSQIWNGFCFPKVRLVSGASKSKAKQSFRNNAIEQLQLLN